MEQQLLTMAQIAKELGLAESTARFYRDRFEDFIPSVGEGRKKRYKPETVEVLRFIADGFNRNLTTADIEGRLTRVFARNIEVEKETAITTAAQQQPNNDTLQAVLKHMNATMRIIADQKEEFAELRKYVADIENRQKEQQEYIDTTLKERDQKLMESIRQVQETKKKWWHWRK